MNVRTAFRILMRKLTATEAFVLFCDWVDDPKMLESMIEAHQSSSAEERRDMRRDIAEMIVLLEGKVRAMRLYLERTKP